MKREINKREIVGEKDSQWRRMALNETTETVRLSGKSRCAISPPVWREPHRAKRDLRGSIDRRKAAKWKRETFFINHFSIQRRMRRMLRTSLRLRLLLRLVPRLAARIYRFWVLREVRVLINLRHRMWVARSRLAVLRLRSGGRTHGRTGVLQSRLPHSSFVVERCCRQGFPGR